MLRIGVLIGRCVSGMLILAYLFHVVCGGIDIKAMSGSKKLEQHTLDIDAAVTDAAISADSKFIALEAVKSKPQGSEIEYTEEIEIWEWRPAKLIANKILSIRRFSNAGEYKPIGASVTYSNNGSKLFLCREGHLTIFAAQNLDVLNDVDLHRSEWPHPGSSLGLEPRVADLIVDAKGKLAAVLLSRGAFEGGELRVYDTDSLKLVRKWEFEKVAFPLWNPVSIDPDGRRVALALVPFEPGTRKLRSEERNVIIMDVDSGHKLRELNTGYLAGGISFSGSNSLLTVSQNPDPKRFRDDTLKVWDVGTGALVHEIRGRPGGIHYIVRASASGRIVLAYVGVSVGKGSFLTEPVVLPVNQRFALYDLDTGEPISVSPDLIPMQTNAPPLLIGAKGDVVITFTVHSRAPLSVFELR
jgi:hypothetical protein